MDIAEIYDGGQAVSHNKLVGEKPPFWWMTRLLVGIMIVAAVMLGWTVVRDSLIARGQQQGRQSAPTELRKLSDELATAKAELKRKQSVLDTEIARKKELGVLYERAEAARKQAVADHKTLADKLRAIEAKQSPPPPARTKRG